MRGIGYFLNVCVTTACVALYLVTGCAVAAGPGATQPIDGLHTAVAVQGGGVDGIPLCPPTLPSVGTSSSCSTFMLRTDDAFLIGRVNVDPDDVAREAKVAASCTDPDGAAAHVLSGVTRAVHGPKGAPPDRAMPGTHRWMSDPGAGLPAWLELRWERRVRPAEVQLVFDSGLHRVLTLTHSDAYAAKMVWGTPQPETVRDYALEGRVDGAWQTLIRVANNYQRRRVHRFERPDPVTALRLTVAATNGLDHARVCEVRVYEA